MRADRSRHFIRWLGDIIFFGQEMQSGFLTPTGDSAIVAGPCINATDVVSRYAHL